MTVWRPLIGAMLILATGGMALAEPTHITVRVLGRDSTFVGSATGGIEITLKNAGDGTVLAQGVTEGTPGDGDLIMGPKARGQVIATDMSAVFNATIDIAEPTHVRLEARGPLKREISMNAVTQTMWVMPGKHLTGGNGWLVEMPGLIVEWLWPTPGLELDAGAVELRAHVTPMCGCGIQPKGWWKPESYEVAVVLKRKGKTVGEYPLTFANVLSLFSATVDLDPGEYDAVLYAYDAATGNTGIDRASFVIEDDE